MNKEYILDKIKPFLNNKGMLREDDFNELFYRLDKKSQYEIVNILIESNIEIDYDYIAVEERENITRPVNVTLNTVKIDKLSNEQLCVIYQQGNRFALEALIIKNTKLVWSRVLKYSKKYKHKLDEEDLVQYGTIGLMKAAERFDLKKEAKFTTYAIWWVDQQILRSIVDYGFTIRIPVHYFEQVNSLMRVLVQNSGCSKQQIYELVKDKGVEKEKFEEILIIAENVMSLTSLNTYVGEDEESELGDFKVDNITPSTEEQVEYILCKETIELVLSTLSQREKDILERRFGLKDGIERTLEQVGFKYGVTRERIRQIEAKALRKLRHPSRSKGLKDFL